MGSLEGEKHVLNRKNSAKAKVRLGVLRSFVALSGFAKCPL